MGSNPPDDKPMRQVRFCVESSGQDDPPDPKGIYHGKQIDHNPLPKTIYSAGFPAPWIITFG